MSSECGRGCWKVIEGVGRWFSECIWKVLEGVIRGCWKVCQ